MLMLLFLLLFFAAAAQLAPWLCARRAIRQCGEGKVKLSHVTRNMTLGATFSVSDDCQIECFRERRPSANPE